MSWCYIVSHESDAHHRAEAHLPIEKQATRNVRWNVRDAARVGTRARLSRVDVGLTSDGNAPANNVGEQLNELQLMRLMTQTPSSSSLQHVVDVAMKQGVRADVAFSAALDTHRRQFNSDGHVTPRKLTRTNRATWTHCYSAPRFRVCAAILQRRTASCACIRARR